MRANYIIAIVTSLLVLCSASIISYSAITITSYHEYQLSNATQLIGCRTDFVTAQIKVLTSNVSSLSYLNTNLTTLQSDQAQLQSYAQLGNTSEFTSYLHNNYEPDLANLHNSAVKGFRSAGVQKNLKFAMLASFRNLDSAYQNCTLDTEKQLIEAKIKDYQAIIAQRQINMNNTLSGDGINISSITQIFDGAQTQIIAPLQASINSSSNLNNTQLLQVYRNYCLFDGCAKGINYHLDAKLGIQLLTLVLQKVRTITNNTSAVIVTQNEINNASAELSSVGTTAYTNQSSNIIWTNISAARTNLKSILAQLKNSTSS